MDSNSESTITMTTPTGYGPLAFLLGVWEGVKGIDHAPDSNKNDAKTQYLERITFEEVGGVKNHSQTLHTLRYKTIAWPMGPDGTFSKEPFHEELGYWHYDPVEKQVMKAFLVPRGVSVIAGCTADPDAQEFTMVAKLGSPTYGICSNPFLDREFKTVRFTLKFTKHGNDSFSYAEDTEIEIKGKPNVFHHTDANTFKRKK